MKLLWAAVAVVVYLVSSSVGFTVPGKAEFLSEIELENFEKDRNLPTLLRFMEKGTTEYMKIILFMLADWSAAIPESLAYMRKPLLTVGKLLDSKLKPFLKYLKDTAYESRNVDKNTIRERDVNLWRSAALSGFEMVKTQLNFENLREKDFPSLEFFKIPPPRDMFNGFHTHVMKLLSYIGMNIQSVRIYLNEQIPKVTNSEFMLDKQLRDLEDKMHAQSQEYTNLLRSHKEELSHYDIKKNNVAYEKLIASHYNLTRMSYDIYVLNFVENALRHIGKLVTDIVDQYLKVGAMLISDYTKENLQTDERQKKTREAGNSQRTLVGTLAEALSLAVELEVEHNKRILHRDEQSCKDLDGTMKLLWAAVVVVVYLVSSSIGFTVPDKADFLSEIELENFEKDRNLPTLLRFMEKGTTEYMKIMLFKIADWSAAIPESLAYLRKPLLTVGELLDSKLKPFLKYLKDTAYESRNVDKITISEGDVNLWRKAALDGFKIVKKQLNFENLTEKDFPLLEFVKTPQLHDSYEFMLDKQLRDLVVKIHAQLQEYKNLHRSHKEELSHYAIKKNNVAFKKLIASQYNWMRMSYVIDQLKFDKSKQ
ncbi:hypothetical protein GE061_018257 [Apolygus lucorum]|uniref:Uncharacterized protein n=1 Tax=Apolygus lucorum TaxID=248454 RepID=A0A8S9XEQ1_APOLU|nr:hypothetical protein GE061_018257 [Apolygus lucorum]